MAAWPRRANSQAQCSRSRATREPHGRRRNACACSASIRRVYRTPGRFSAWQREHPERRHRTRQALRPAPQSPTLDGRPRSRAAHAYRAALRSAHAARLLRRAVRLHRHGAALFRKRPLAAGSVAELRSGLPRPLFTSACSTSYPPPPPGPLPLRGRGNRAGALSLGEGEGLGRYVGMWGRQSTRKTLPVLSNR